MDALLFKLEEILIRETELYQKILDISRRKTDIIIAGDTAGLDQITRTEQGLILHGGALERELKQCIQEIMQANEEFSSCVTLALLIQKIPEPYHQRLASIGNDLNSLLQEQKEINVLNSSLIQSNLEYIYNILSKVQGGSRIYSMGGIKVNKDLEPSILDKKI